MSNSTPSSSFNTKQRKGNNNNNNNVDNDYDDYDDAVEFLNKNPIFGSFGYTEYASFDLADQIAFHENLTNDGQNNIDDKEIMNRWITVSAHDEVFVGKDVPVELTKWMISNCSKVVKMVCDYYHIDGNLSKSVQINYEGGIITLPVEI